MSESNLNRGEECQWQNSGIIRTAEKATISIKSQRSHWWSTKEEVRIQEVKQVGGKGNQEKRIISGVKNTP